MVRDDQRRVIRLRLYTKELNGTAMAECARKYVPRSKSKEVAGTVLECTGKKTRNYLLSIYVKAV